MVIMESLGTLPKKRDFLRVWNELPWYCRTGCKKTGECAATLFAQQSSERWVESRAGLNFSEGSSNKMVASLRTSKACAKENMGNDGDDVALATLEY